MDSAGLGQAMGEHYREELSKKAIEETENLRKRVAFLEETLIEVVDTLRDHGIYSTRGNERELQPCPFCGCAMQPRHALWPSEGDTDGIIHAAPTDCPVDGFSIGTADEGVSVAAVWNKRAPVAEDQT